MSSPADAAGTSGTTDAAVLVVGSGAAATFAVAGLARRGIPALAVGDAPRPGPGVAYATADPQHRLNVPASEMGATPEDPGAFLRWIRCHRDHAFSPDDFAPRSWYGDYLADVLDEARSFGDVSVRRGRVCELVPTPTSGGPAAVDAVLDDGSRVRARAVILCTGPPPPTPDWASDAQRRDPRFVGDPWAPGVLERLTADRGRRRVLLVGTGLTMVDLALSLTRARPDVQLTAVSRSGRLPAVHRPDAPAALPAPSLPRGPLPLHAVRGIVRDVVADAVVRTSDWRPGIDALRPVTPALWGALSYEDRLRFLAEDRRSWEVLRHRMAPQVGDAIARLRRSGQLTVRARGEGGTSTTDWAGYDAVVSCTGQGGATAQDPLLARLLDRGAVRTDPLGLGLDCTVDGRPLTADGRPWGEVFVVGALRKGQLWESTAVPELRTQADDIASRLLGHDAAGSRVA